MRKLLDEGTDVNMVDELGFTALHVAALRGDRDMVEFLYNRSADVSAATYFDKKTAMTYAAEQKQSAVLSFLLEKVKTDMKGKGSAASHGRHERQRDHNGAVPLTHNFSLNISRSMKVVQRPVFEPQGGTFGPDSEVAITLTCSTAGAQIFYTVDGSTPTPSSAMLVRSSTRM
ncbi:hypothetical protein GUITHDRAFT_105079 [Guillardia theta CCMP2712]|uniref:GH29D-like beta-sandwich domain-containing protein n=1 Tax=Guillardia theta (strain CCMP2712) TaxID=905079 RepID=L1JKE2_GUITC|nr:hypothetical protein GUITHDRAFT_105079 [Guillardia theta CCMP2712]EKX48993.1 hypothetical protein GUITHDRAFT_105079 [Guillardia theta CCMP2712]|eukprot:XP_005835973.1 hypothetical protein GUITHDRAFT_105079 [Guillardia theta CCMP2712]